MINILMTRTNDDDGVYLRFPASPAEIGEAFAEMDSISTDTSAMTSGWKPITASRFAGTSGSITPPARAD